MTYTGAEVAALRTAMGLSGDGLAACLGVNPRTVRGWESGRDVMGEGAAAALRRLAAEHRALVDAYSRTEEIIVIERHVGVDVGLRPRGWYLAAAGQALAIEPDLRIDWLEDVGEES